MKTINIVLKIEDTELVIFDNWIRDKFDVVDLKVLPNTERLYLNDPIFKKLVKHVKDAQRQRDLYINDKN